MKSKNICIIPIRSKSKSIINKNIKKINGIPLICFTLNSCLESKIFDKIIIVSDSKKYLTYIKKLLIRNQKVVYYLRSKKSATGKSPSEYILEEVIKTIRERKNSLSTDSYTKKLLSDKKLSLSKVKEEVAELIEAVEKSTNKIHESADVLYHLVVYLEANDIKIEEVMNELKKRQK